MKIQNKRDIMKKNLGATLALYPAYAVVVERMEELRDVVPPLLSEKVPNSVRVCNYSEPLR